MLPVRLGVRVGKCVGKWRGAGLRWSAGGALKLRNVVVNRRLLEVGGLGVPCGCTCRRRRMANRETYIFRDLFFSKVTFVILFKKGKKIKIDNS